MGLPGFDELIDRADARNAMVPIVVAGAADETVLGALARAAARGWVDPILAGEPEAIEQAAKDCGVDLSAMRIVASTDPAAAAVAEVRSGAARLLMKGRSTPQPCCTRSSVPTLACERAGRSARSF